MYEEVNNVFWNSFQFVLKVSGTVERNSSLFHLIHSETGIFTIVASNLNKSKHLN